jgi:hypothetical protein
MKIGKGGDKKHLNQGINVTNCSCKSEYQDKKYGKGLRLHNATQNAANKWRCTACGVSR